MIALAAASGIIVGISPLIMVPGTDVRRFLIASTVFLWNNLSVSLIAS